jgi:hypothetical protein
MDTDSRQQPVTNKCADDAYYKIADESEPSPSNDFSGKPTGDETDR